jgi:hypothetical protein
MVFRTLGIAKANAGGVRSLCHSRTIAPNQKCAAAHSAWRDPLTQKQGGKKRLDH